MNLVIDYGNSSAKVGIFDEHRLVEKQTFTEKATLEKFIENFSGEYLIVSTVNHELQAILKQHNFKKVFMLSHRLPLPVTLAYATPDTLGPDRVAAVCGAWEIFPNTNCLVIDAGSCITYEFLSKDGVYFGGGISPGMRMRFNAMHSFTARLPLVEPIENAELIGNSTETCMQSGVINGMIEEINGIISRYSEKFQGLKVILCGGDGPFFENKLKASIFAAPELVLGGLNSILRYNAYR